MKLNQYIIVLCIGVTFNSFSAHAHLQLTVHQLPAFGTCETEEFTIFAHNYDNLTFTCSSNNPLTFEYDFGLDGLRDSYMKSTKEYLHRQSQDFWNLPSYNFIGYLNTKMNYIADMGIIICRNTQYNFVDAKWIVFRKSSANESIIEVSHGEFSKPPLPPEALPFLSDNTTEITHSCTYQFEYIVDPSTQLSKWRCVNLLDRKLTAITFAYCYSRLTCMNLRRQTQLKLQCVKWLSRGDACVGCTSPQTTVTTNKQYLPQIAFCDTNSAVRYFYTFAKHQPNFHLDKSTVNFQRLRPRLVRIVRPANQTIFKRNENVEVECHVDQFYLSSGSRIAIEINGTFQFFPQRNYDAYKRNATTNVNIVIETIRPMQSGKGAIYCFGPVADSCEWLNASLPIIVLDDDYRFQQNADAYEKNLTKLRRDWEVSQAESDKGKLPKIVIGILGGVMALVVIIVVAFFYWRLRRVTNQVNKLTSQDIKNFKDGTGGIEGANDAHIDSLPYNSQYEVPKSQIKIDRTSLLGSGAYGTVAKGVVWIRNELKEIAVKTIRPEADVMYLKALLSELKVMAYLGNGHDNILHLVAASTRNMDKEEVLVGVELCEMSLLEAVRQRSKIFVNFVRNGAFEPPAPTAYENLGPAHRSLSTVDLVNWSHQIANGMDYIASKRVVHGDLSLRNVLLTASQSAKICDFGLARQMVDYNYIKTEQCPLPWKWMAIETLAERKFSTSSDVWSFGITLWEIFSLGQEPYAGLTWTPNFVEQLRNGLRMSKPQFASDEIHDVMVKTWMRQPTDRPTFAFLKDVFSRFLQEVTLCIQKGKGS